MRKFGEPCSGEIATCRLPKSRLWLYATPVASGDTYTSWDDRDSEPQGERGFGYFGSQSDRDNGRSSSDLDRSSSLPVQRGSYGNDSYRDQGYRDDPYGGAPSRDDHRADEQRGGDHRGADYDEPRRDPRSEIYGDPRRSDGYYGDQRRDQSPTRSPEATSTPPKDVFKRGTGFKNLPGWGRALTALGVLILALVITHLFFFQAFSVPSSAMAPTVQAGNRVLVNKVVYDFRAPKRGEVVLFKGSSKWAPEGSSDADSGIFSSVGSTVGSWLGISSPASDEFFRRVIAVPGDTIACCDVNGHVTVNGKPLNETYVVNDSPVDVSANAPACGSRSFDPVVVGSGSVFVMGDNRVESLDSRCIALVPISKIVGRATAQVWSSWGPLSIPSTFKDVPKPYSMGPIPRTPADNGAGLVVALPVLAAFAGRRAYNSVTGRKGLSLRA
jgi:signal peptidase I